MAGFCQHCNKALPTSKKNPKQKFCGNKECQKARKRQWQKEKKNSDPAYRQNQKCANREWQDKNPDYWRNYHKKNPDYTEKNRIQSRHRMQIKRQVESFFKEFAKMDASTEENKLFSNYYILVPVGDMFAKMDAKFIKISIIQQDSDQDPPVCKERTVSPPPK